MAELYSSPTKDTSSSSPSNSNRPVKPPSSKKYNLAGMDSGDGGDFSFQTASDMYEQEAKSIQDLEKLSHQLQAPGGFQHFHSSPTPNNVGIGFGKSNSPPLVSNAFAPFPAATSGGQRSATKVQSGGENSDAADLWKLNLHDMCQNDENQNLTRVIERLKENNSHLKDKGSFQQKINERDTIGGVSVGYLK